MHSASRETQYDLFVSYAHKNNEKQHADRVNELVEESLASKTSGRLAG